MGQHPYNKHQTHQNVWYGSVDPVFYTHDVHLYQKMCSSTSMISAMEGRRYILRCVCSIGICCETGIVIVIGAMSALFSSAVFSAPLAITEDIVAADALSLFFLLFHFLPCLPYPPPCWVSLLNDQIESLPLAQGVSFSCVYLK